MRHIKYTQKVLVAVGLALTACQNSQFEIKKLETGARETLLCEQSFDNFNDRLYDFWLDKKDLPTTAEFQEEFRQGLYEDSIWSKMDHTTIEHMVEITSDYYDYLANELTRSATEPTEKLKLLTALEIGDQSDDRAQLQQSWSVQKSLLQNRLRELNLPCQQVTERTREAESLNPTAVTKRVKLKTNLPRAVEGLRWAFATAYQSCQPVELPALSARTPAVEGIKILSETHPSGGRKRVYGDVQKIISTHPYYKDTSFGNNCFDATTKPLIYDFGGKPATTTDANAKLDFFTNEGSGTSVLGIDCSGFVFSALARGGLKLAPNKTLKAVSVNGISAKMYKDPVKNGLTCFRPVAISANNGIAPGDIVASQGHVVMVDQIGADPFGLARAKSISDCTAEVLSYKGFDFVITHSTPWKAGVGINRTFVRDYLKNSSTYRTGFEKYAVAFCKSKFQAKDQSDAAITEIKVVRHKGSNDCLAPQPIGLRYESCVQKCSLTNPIPTPI